MKADQTSHLVADWFQQTESSSEVNIDALPVIDQAVNSTKEPLEGSPFAIPISWSVSEDTYYSLNRSIVSIYHCAWPIV